VADLADYLDLAAGQAREQFRALASRRPARGGRQVAFLPAETLLCLAASRPLAQAIQNDQLARQYYGRPPLREVLLLPEGAQPPAVKYLDWHRRKVFVA
jgi:hypothetical protein